MSKVNIQYDTSTKEISVKIDGEELADVCSVSFYPEYSYGEEAEESKLVCSIVTKSEDEDNGVQKSTHYYVGSSAEAKAINKSEAITDLPGFVGQASLDVSKHIADYFLSGLGIK